MAGMLWLLLVTAAHRAFAGPGASAPPWSYAPTYTDYCINSSVPAHPANSRLAFVALPEGAPPAAGWPVYFWFVVDSYSSKNGSYGGPPGTPGSCEPVTRDPSQPVPQSVGPFAAPATVLDACVGIFNGSQPMSGTAGDCSGGVGCTCDFDQLSGTLWSQREKALLVAAGFAVVQLNPWAGDAWDAGPAAPAQDFPGWGAGPDLVVFDQLFARMGSGEMGPLDLTKILFRGWSGGAQMVSWMVQLHMTGELRKLGNGANASMAGGVFTSGGSYACYPFNSSTGIGVCASCDSSPSCAGAGFNGYSGCSTCTKDCGEVHRNGPPCCSKCCPSNYTEQFFVDHPSEWARHPPTFLAQGSSRDGNADLCASQNYHETMVGHNGASSSTLILQPSEYEACGCLGQRSDPAAAGSPYLGLCEETTAAQGGRQFCHMHVMAFAAMVEPVVAWALTVINEDDAAPPPP